MRVRSWQAVTLGMTGDEYLYNLVGSVPRTAAGYPGSGEQN
jgi:hypothetical protein